MRKTMQLSLTAVFAALHAVLYFASFGLWRNWGIYLETIEGVVLGPKIGFFAALLGSAIGRMLRPDPLWMFGIIAEPVSVMAAGFLSKGKWMPVLAAYAVMLSAYFLHPYGRELPLWTILDVLFALVLIYPAARFGGNVFKKDVTRLSVALVMISFVTIATDSLVRIFLLVPGGLYGMIFGDFNTLFLGFVYAAVDSYIEDLIVVVVSLVAGLPIMISILNLKLLENKKTNKK